MASEYDRLNAILVQIDAQLLEMTTAPRPDYSIDGQSVSWNSYYSSLLEKRKLIKEALQQASSPFCVISKART